MRVKKWNGKRGLKKGLYAAGAVAVGMATAVETLGGADKITTASAIAVTAAVVGGIRVALNWWKVNSKP